MSDTVPRTGRGFIYGLPPFAIPAVMTLTSEQVRFPASQLFEFTNPQVGWRSTNKTAQEIGLDTGPTGLAGVLIVRPNMPTITWQEAAPSFSGLRGASGPNVLLSSTLLRQTPPFGEPESPWFTTATGNLFFPTTTTLGNLPHEHWTTFTRCVPSFAATIFQTVSFRTLNDTNQVAGMRVWLRTPPTGVPGATVSIRIVSAATTLETVATLTRSWEAHEVTGTIQHATNTTVSFQLRVTTTGTAGQFDVANVQGWRGYVTKPFLDYTTDALGYQVPIHPMSGRRSLFLELPGLRYYVFGVPASLATDDSSAWYSVGALAGVTAWQSFPVPQEFNEGHQAQQGVRQLELPSLRRQVLTLGGKRLGWDIDLPELPSSVVRTALMQLQGLATGRPFLFFENRPPPFRSLDEELRGGLPLLAYPPAGAPWQGHLARRIGDVRITRSGIVELQSTSLALEEVT